MHLKDNMITFEPDTKEYDIVVPETCKKLYGSINYSSTGEIKSDTAGKIETYDGTTWSSSEAALSGEVIETWLDDTVWSARLVVADKYVTNAAFEEYNLNIKRKKLVKDYKASYSYIAKADHNRTDDLLGKDAEKLVKAVTASELKDGTVLKLMNTSESSYKNWIQGTNYPVHSSEIVLYAIELGGNYKTEYKTGEPLNTDGMLITQKYSDGTTKMIPASEANAKFTGFKSNERGVQTITVTCGVATATYEIRVLYSGSQIPLHRRLHQGRRF